MKKIILIIITLILIVVVGYVIKYSAIEQETQENISEEIAPSGHETDEETMDENYDEHEDHDEHDHSVEIEGSEMKNLTVQEVADLWEIDAEILLSEIIAEFNLKGDYTADVVLEEIRDAEYKFSPAIIKDLAEKIKHPNQD